MKSTPEALESSFEVNIIARKSKNPRFHEINIKNIDFNNIYIFFLKRINQNL